MSLFEAAVLGVVQGLTEFLPVSSSAHLLLVPWVLGWADGGRAFDAAIHLGTIAAVLAYFWKDWTTLAAAAVKAPTSAEGRLAWAIVPATVPAGLLGLALSGSDALRAPPLTVVTLTAFGLLLGWAYARGPKTIGLADVTARQALLIGLAQALALVPGVSRSGITLTAGLLLGLTPDAAARFSFLLSLPITLAAGLHEALKLSPDQLAGPFWVGAVASGVTGLAAIRILMGVLAKGVRPFVIYRVGLAALILGLYLYRR